MVVENKKNAVASKSSGVATRGGTAKPAVKSKAKAKAKKATESLSREEKARKQALTSALSTIERAYGKGSIMTLGDGTAIKVDGISTGSVSLDLALGGYGIPRGRITEIYGPESSGKTTLCSHVVAHAQKAGGICAFIDAEHAFDSSYAKSLGVNLDELLVSQPDNGEQALEIAETLIRSNAVDVVVIDSVAALVPKAEIDGEMGDRHVGLQARLMSQALRKLTAIVHKSNTVV
ncbi:MAG: DNA recombination/repair protein RecA, partial [Rhodothermaceae bacterium]|nr:DNA recombination/repair protein RecA [Rhodothermaceae bacterium]